MLQLIKIHPITIRVNKTDYEYIKPKYLTPVNKLQLIEAKVKGSCMAWNVQGKQITYNQIKQLAYEHSITNKSY